MATRKAAIRSTVRKSASAAKVASTEGEGDEARVVTNAPVTGEHEPRVESTAAAEASAPIPNVQAEASHASQAPEDTRNAEVAAPNTTATAPSGAHVETYGGGTAWECSDGDFVSRQSAAAVEEHIAAKHSGKK